MGFNRFSPGTEFLWKDEIYKVIRYLAGNKISIERVKDGEYISVTYDSLTVAIHKSELSFLGAQSCEIQQPQITLQDYSENQQQIAKYRFQVIHPLLKKQRIKKDVENRVEEIKKQQKAGTLPKLPISVISVYRWIKLYTTSGEDIRALVPRNRKSSVRKSFLHPQVEKIVIGVIEEYYYRREKVTLSTLQNEIARQIKFENHNLHRDGHLSIPSKSTIWRKLHSLDLHKRMLAKRGRNETERFFSQYEKSSKPLLPLQRVEIDHTLTDFVVVDEKDGCVAGRLTLTFCIDVATRYPLGYYLGFEPPNYLTVASCLSHAIQPKPDVQKVYETAHPWLAYGLPHMLVVDNGPEFIGNDLQDACLSFGIILQQTP
ncbi:MAG: hypothetical protein AAF490_11810, partial [Chloroflexota bacterium]